MRRRKSRQTVMDRTGAAIDGPRQARLPKSPIEALELRVLLSGYTANEIRGAYGLGSASSPAVQFGQVSGDGTGQTIAIVDAYDDSANLPGDLKAFDTEMGLPAPPSFQILNEYGNASPLPSTDPAGPVYQQATAVRQSWEEEEALDVEWAHAIAPGANIVLYECQNSFSSSLDQGAITAASAAGTSVVSMSFDYQETPDAPNEDSAFITPAGHQGVTFLAASGDTASPPAVSPATSPDVVSVGGTVLTTDAAGDHLSEVAWSKYTDPETGFVSGGGGGPSAYEPLPSYQAGLNGINGASTVHRNTPDVSAIASGAGAAIYDSYDNPASPSQAVGGTSLATPIWAGIIAIADQGRAAAGAGTLDGRSQTLPLLYSAPSSDFYDITQGNNGYPAGVGYDLATGLGSPIGNKLIPFLVDDASAGGPYTVSQNANIALAASSSLPNPTYTWDFNYNPANPSQFEVDAQGIAPTFSAAGLAPGVHTIALKVSENGFTDLVTTTVTVKAAPAGGSISGATQAPAAYYNLTSVGTGDWIHFGTGGNYTATVHKVNGNNQISNFTTLGNGSYGGYTNPARSVVWGDGTPTTALVDTGYVWANNALGAGFSFTAPADTTTRTLYVYAGGYSSGATLTATLSDGSAAPYSASFSGSGIYQNVVAITYSAASAGQTLNISYTKSSNIGGTAGSADLIAAWLASTTPVIPVAVTLNPTNQTVTAGQSATFTAAASGLPAPNVQWYYKGPFDTLYSIVSGGTSDTLVVPSTTTAQSGTLYEAYFVNVLGSVATSSAATLTVNPAPAGGSLAGTSSASAAPYNLTALGTADWVHFGVGGNYAVTDRKATGNSQISNFTAVGTGGFGGYTNSARTVSWSDGSPTTSSTDSGYVWANNAIGSGFSFTAPADTTTRTLYVYVGGYSSGSTLTATLSDGSAAPYTVSFSGNALYQNVVAITYAAASANQKLTISYTKTSNINGTSGSADLIAAWLAGAPVSTAPSISSNPTNQTVTAGQSATFTAAASGSPTPTVQWYSEAPGASSFTAISGATSTSLIVPSTTTAQSGTKYEAVFSNGVGSPATTTAATLTVNPAPVGGSLSGTSSASAAPYNLTALGTADWVHFGVGGNYAVTDRKATGNTQISNFTAVGTGGFGGYTNSARTVTWGDGTPTASSTDSGYVWANNALGSGFSFTAPADTTTRTLYVYVGGYSSGATLTATLSDGSAAPYTVSLSGNAAYQNVVAITYSAASANQKLTISYTKTTNLNGTSGSADLIAAWLH